VGVHLSGLRVFFIGKHSDQTSTTELTAMHEELTNMRQLVALSMLKQQSGQPETGRRELERAHARAGPQGP